MRSARGRHCEPCLQHLVRNKIVAASGLPSTPHGTPFLVVVTPSFWSRCQTTLRHTSSYGDRTLAAMDLACGTLFRSSCAIQTSPTDCSCTRQLKGHLFREAWKRRSVSSDMRRIEKHLLTYLLTYLHVRSTWCSVHHPVVSGDVVPAGTAPRGLTMSERTTTTLHLLISGGKSVGHSQSPRTTRWHWRPNFLQSVIALKLFIIVTSTRVVVRRSTGHGLLHIDVKYVQKRIFKTLKYSLYTQTNLVTHAWMPNVNSHEFLARECV